MDTWERFSLALKEAKKVEEECGSEENNTKSKKKIVDLRGMRTDINLVKNKLRAMGLKMAQELEGEQLDEFLNTGRVVAGRSQTSAGNRYTQAGTVQKVLGVTVPGSFQQGVSASDVQRHNQKSSSNTQIKPNKVSTDQLLGKKPGGQYTDGITPDKKPAAPTAKPAVPAAKPQTASAAMSQVFKGTPLSGVANIANRFDRQSNYRDHSPETRRMLGLQNSYEQEGELVDEGKKDLPQTKMYRKAGNLARQALSSKGAKKEKAMDRSAKIVSAITRETERKRFDEIGKSPAHNSNYKEDFEIEEGMSLKDFKSNRRKITGAEERADARKRGHEGKTWADSGRTYSPDEAKSRRTKMNDVDRSARHSTAVDPDNEDTDSYSADKTKNPKKLRKQKAMGELGEGYIEEKSLSRAQQRFFGMVRAAQDGKMKSLSPEVAKAAKEMTTKQAHDFAATKHKGLPEKKEVKEEISLVEKMIVQYSPISEIELDLTEAPKDTISGGTSKSAMYKSQAKGARAAQMGGAAMEGDMGEVQRLGQTKTTIKKSKSDQEPDQEQTPTTSQKKKGRGQGDTSGYARGAAITAAARIKLAKMKRQDQLKDRQERLKKTEKEKRESSIKSAGDAAEKDYKETTQKRRENRAGLMTALRGSGATATSKQSDLDVLSAMGSNVGSAAKGLIGHGIKRYQQNKDERNIAKLRKDAENKASQPKTKTEGYSNWREELIIEVDDASVTNNQPEKIIDVSKKRNKIEINPKLAEQKQHLHEFLPALLAALELGGARAAGSLAVRSVAAGAGEAAAAGETSTLGSKVKDALKGKVQDTITGKQKKPSEEPTTATSSQNDLDALSAMASNIKKEEFSDWRFELEEGAAWQRKEGKNPEGGLNKKGIASYRRENPGSKLSLAVTTPPSKLDPDSKSAKRRKSFCARMGGMPGPMKDEKGRPTRKALSLRKWNC
jgi:hypothetical protein